MKLAHFPYAFWAGTEDCLDSARAVYDLVMSDVSAAVQAGVVLGPREAPADTPPTPYNFSLQGSVGVVTIRGPLLNIDSEYARYRGATTYPDIQRAMVYAASNPDVKMILLDIGSGGGAVSGVEDTATQIRMINDKVKPVYAVASDVMASAAYWLGASAGKVFNGRTSMLGSIGVITTHMEYSAMLKEAGIGVKVIRAGEYKALASSVEPLSKAAEASIQDQLNATYEVFSSTMADMRGVSLPVLESTMAQGRQFIGQAAVDVGLSDGLVSFDALVSKMNQKILDKAAKTHNNLTYSPTRNDMSRTALTTQQVAELVAQGPEAVAAALAAAAAPAATVVAGEAATAALAAVVPGVTEYLQGQVVALNAKVAEMSVQLTAAQADATKATALIPGLTAVVAGSLTTMRVALNLAAVDHTSSTPEALLADHAAVTKTYAESFKPGGHAASAAVTAAAEAGVQGTNAGIDPLALAQATRATPFRNK